LSLKDRSATAPLLPMANPHIGDRVHFFLRFAHRDSWAAPNPLERYPKPASSRNSGPLYRFFKMLPPALFREIAFPVHFILLLLCCFLLAPTLPRDEWSSFCHGGPSLCRRSEGKVPPFVWIVASTVGLFLLFLLGGWFWGFPASKATSISRCRGLFLWEGLSVFPPAVTIPRTYGMAFFSRPPRALFSRPGG